MRWEDERYVRLYTRDTTGWVLLPWQSRCLLPLLLRKVDRAGVIEVQEGEVAKALEELLKVPAEVVEVGLAGLIGRRIFVLEAGRLLMPNFLEAQECSQSDKIRKQVSRARAAKPDASTPLVTAGHATSHPVTDGHTASHEVADGHSPSRLVTPSLAVPSRAEPSLPEQNIVEQARRGVVPSADATRVFEHWQLATGRSGKFIGKRLKAVEARLRDGYTVDQLKAAVDRRVKSAFVNDKGVVFNDLELICRDASQVEREYATPPASKGPVDPTTQHHVSGEIHDF